MVLSLPDLLDFILNPVETKSNRVVEIQKQNLTAKNLDSIERWVREKLSSLYYLNEREKGMFFLQTRFNFASER